MGTVGFAGIPARKSHGVRSALLPVCALLGLALGAAGAVLLSSVSWAEVTRYLDARNWPTTEGRIVSISLMEDRQAEAGTGVPAVRLMLTVAYEYEVDGRAFTGYRASFDDRSAPFDRRLRALFGRLNFARLMDRPVPVAYDPDEPELAYLDRDFDWWPAALRAGLGCGAVLFGIGVALGGLRRRGGASSL